MAKEGVANTVVLDNMAHYTDLVLLPKYTDQDKIHLLPENKGHSDTVTGFTDFQHVNQDNGYLLCRKNVVFKKHYSFKLFVKSFMEDPIFRFESAGGRHNNPKNCNAPLLQRTVKTPHFHRYDTNGIEYAYRTDFIEDNEDSMLEDINLALKVYCQECCVSAKSGRDIAIPTQLVLFPSLPPADPHNNVKF